MTTQNVAADEARSSGKAEPIFETSTTLYDGTFTATTTAAALNSGTTIHCTEVLVQNDPGSAVNIKVGNATSQSVVLTPGQSYSISVKDVSLVFVKSASATPTVNWSARS